MGYVGKILNVDLAKRKIKTETLNDVFYRKWLGGYGVGSRTLYNHMAPNEDPLGPGNILGITTGVLTGTLAPFSGSMTVVAKSPLTGYWGDARAGGFFGSELRSAGFDDIFFYGRSEKPVYLWINDGEAEIRDASDIWGKNVRETEKILKEAHNDEKVQVASIGRSGEELSSISAVMTDEGRAAARSGLGAVMGSKKLKAVAVRGTGKILVAHTDRLLEYRKRIIGLMKENPMFDRFATFGTTGGTHLSAFSGDSGVKNWGGSGKEDFPTAEKLSGENVKKYTVRKYACFGCPVGCGALQRVQSGPYACEGHRPEYETLAAFGSMCLNDNVESIIHLNHICNEYGLDTISVGGTIAFAIECYENGIITENDTEGVKLTWGNSDAMVAMTRKLAANEGFGKILFNGVKVASQKIGKGSERFAMHVCGQEIPQHDPRLLTNPYNSTCQLMYVSDATPARHTQSPGIGFASQASGMCMFSGFLTTATEEPPKLSDLVNAVTGWNLTMDDMLVIANRIVTMRQLFNIREGWKPSDFTYPDRILGKLPLKSGPLAGVTIDPDPRRREYYESLGWDPKTGRPSKAKLAELELEAP